MSVVADSIDGNNVTFVDGAVVCVETKLDFGACSAEIKNRIGHCTGVASKFCVVVNATEAEDCNGGGGVTVCHGSDTHELFLVVESSGFG